MTSRAGADQTLEGTRSVPAENPTPGELSRRLDDIARRLDQIADSVARLPSAELIAAQQGRIVDRVTQVERDIERINGAIEKLAAALETERKSRADAIEQEQNDRQKAIEAEKTRIGTWTRWLLAGIATALGTAISQALGLGGHASP